VKAATVVDHIIAHKGNANLFWDESNWQALCKRCHNSKTAAADGRWGRGIQIFGMISVGAGARSCARIAKMNRGVDGSFSLYKPNATNIRNAGNRC